MIAKNIDMIYITPISMVRPATLAGRTNLSADRRTLGYMHADAWAALGQWATVAIAGAAAWIAIGQLREMRKTRERVAQPDVVVYVDQHEVRRYMDLVIKNFGQTTAYNVRVTLPPLQVVPYKNRETREEVTSLYFPRNLAVLAPGQEWRTVWDSAVRRENYKGTLQDVFVGRVEFDDKMHPAGKPSFCNPISLDIKMFWSTMWIERSSNKSVQDALYEIAGTLKKFGQEHDGIWVYNSSAAEELQWQEAEVQEAMDANDQSMDELFGGTPQQQRQLGDGN